MTRLARNRFVRSFPGTGVSPLHLLLSVVFLLFGAVLLGAQEHGQWWDPQDPRIGLSAGWMDAGEASWNLELLSNTPKPAGFVNPEDPGDGSFANTDVAFQGDLVFVGNYNGFTAWDVSDPRNPRLRLSVLCPGGQGDISVFGNLVFMSAQETRGRVDCGDQGVEAPVSPERFRGVRIFDVGDFANPRQVAAVQTCRGSHTHTLVTSPADPAHIYVYNSGTSGVRPAEEMEGCSGLLPEEDPNTSLFQIEVIQVPLAAPHEARIVNEPRIFSDPETGAIEGLWPGGDHGPGTQPSRRTSQCHDITSYPEIGLAAGACSGNGILLDIRDPVNPTRVDAVLDRNFVFWHSATFNNDGTKVLFTDEWGGGSQPRCRETDSPEWGANAIFDIVDGRMEHRSYYKLPVPQTETENCVAHNGSLIPVPGRDIKVQAWYQGGISVLDFTDSSNPFEIAFFDRGPISDEQLHLGGHWGAYWYNGLIVGSEIARGLDVLRLTPSEHLSQNEIDAALLVRMDEFNPQHQPRKEWPAGFPVPRALLDQLNRSGSIDTGLATQVSDALARAEGAAVGADRSGALESLETLARQVEAAAASASGHAAHRHRLLAGAIGELTASLR